MSNRTLKRIYRSGGIGGLVGWLTAMEFAGLVVFGLMRRSPDPGIAQYAHFGFVLAGGLCTAAFGVLSSDTADTAMDSSSKLENKGERAPMVIALVALAFAFVSLACMAYNANAPGVIRGWGWVTLGLFCVLATNFASRTHGKIEEDPRTPLQVRWAFAVSFLYLPLHFHFGLLWWLAIAMLAVQAVLVAWVLFRWEKSPRVEIPSIASPA